jgi:hypothetical protein
MKNHIGLLFVHEGLRKKLTWTINANKWHLVACELHNTYDIIYNIAVFGATLTTFITSLIALKLHKQLKLQVSNTTQNYSYNPSYRNCSFFTVALYMSKQKILTFHK